jgi:hypothetical protein
LREFCVLIKLSDSVYFSFVFLFVLIIFNSIFCIRVFFILVLISKKEKKIRSHVGISVVGQSTHTKKKEQTIWAGSILFVTTPSRPNFMIRSVHPAR